MFFSSGKNPFVILCPLFFTSGRRVGVSKHLGPKESEGGGLVSSSLVIRSHLSKGREFTSSTFSGNLSVSNINLVFGVLSSKTDSSNTYSS